MRAEVELVQVGWKFKLGDHLYSDIPPPTHHDGWEPVYVIRAEEPNG